MYATVSTSQESHTKFIGPKEYADDQEGQKQNWQQNLN